MLEKGVTRSLMKKFSSRKLKSCPGMKCTHVMMLTKLFRFSPSKLPLLDQLAPVRTIQTRNRYAPWLSAETKENVRKRDSAQRRAT